MSRKIIHTSGAPLIGIAAISLQDGNYPPVKGVRNTYIDSVLKAGGIPVIIPQLGDFPQHLEEVLSLCNGLLMCGGTDIDPSLYGAKRHPLTEPSDQSRDRSEIKLLEIARQRRLPIFGICRGCQLLNVAFGGTLYQDLPSEAPDMAYHGRRESTVMNVDNRHYVNMKSGSRLSEIYGQKISVNSIHHQGIKDVGAGLVASAVADDGLVEGVESQEYFVLGVQWHPEIMWQNEPEQIKPFLRFIKAATEHMKVARAA